MDKPVRTANAMTAHTPSIVFFLGGRCQRTVRLAVMLVLQGPPACIVRVVAHYYLSDGPGGARWSTSVKRDVERVSD